MIEACLKIIFTIKSDMSFNCKSKRSNGEQYKLSKEDLINIMKGE